MYAQTALKKRRAVKSLMEMEAGDGTLLVRQGDIVDENDPTTLSTPSKEEKTARTKLAKHMAPLCSMCDVDFRILMKAYESGVDKDQNQNSSFLLASTRTTYVWIETMILRSRACLVRKIKRTWPTYRERWWSWLKMGSFYAPLIILPSVKIPLL